ncbi:MAG: hypothetical protein KKD75_02105 [Nanoarchaeota archaeon]|nr:hypothetical protein [Nanoarchaeota archaeon]MBU1875542.1 hypothetical protein [Nanoarchaeota archaeon]
MKNSKIIMGVIILLIFMVSAFIFQSFYVIKETRLMPADVHISEKKIGFNLDKDALHFGIVPIGAVSSKRFVTITNKWNYGVDVLLSGKGDIKDWVNFETKMDNGTYNINGFYLEPKEERNISVYLIPSNDAKVGEHYEGYVRFTLKRNKLFG